MLLSSSVDFLPGILIWWNLELRCERLQGGCWESMISQQACRLPASASSSSAAGLRNLLQAAVVTKLTKWVFSLLLLLQQQHLQQQLLLFFRSCSCLVHARILHTSLDSKTPNPRFLQILAPIQSQIPEIPSHINVIQPRNGMCFVRFSDVLRFDLD